jgi:hypothetical protein
MQPTLRVYETVGAAFRLTFRNFRVMLGLALLPMVLAVLLPSVMRLDVEESISPELHMIHAVVRLFLLSVFAVAWHRYLLLGKRDTSVALQFWPGFRDVRYFGRLALFLLPQEVFLAVAQPTNLFPVFLLLLATIIAISPFALAFPAIALETYTGLGASRRFLQGATLQLVGAIFISFVGIIVLLFMFVGILGPLLLVNFGPGAMFSFFNALTFLTAAIPIAVLSVAYRSLGGPGCAPTGPGSGGPRPIST